jgi:hypothetical protein
MVGSKVPVALCGEDEQTVVAWWYWCALLLTLSPTYACGHASPGAALYLLLVAALHQAAERERLLLA